MGFGREDLLTQSEYDRRINDPAWPSYKRHSEYEVDPRSGWHSGGGYDMPDIAIAPWGAQAQ